MARATIVDVARLANVSTSTVSHVINGTRYVSDEKRNQVLAAVEMTGYRQDSVARALRRARTDSIGLIVSSVSQTVFGEMIRGVEQEAVQAGYTLLLANSAEDGARESASLHALVARKVDGLIVAPAARSPWREIDALGQTGIPVVIMDRASKARTDMVGVENTDPMRQLTTHVIAHGHTKIALATGDMKVSTITERARGFTQAMAAAGLDVPEEYVLTGSGLSEDVRRQVSALLESPSAPTAIIATSTESAIGTLEAIDAKGLLIPGDIAFATFDGFAHPDLFRPRITTITQPAFEIGASAMRLLLDRLSTTPPTRSRILRLSPEILYRESCGCTG